MTSEQLSMMRAYLKEFKFVAPEEKYQEDADVANGLLPALVDSITDEELSSIIEEFRSYLLYSIIAGPASTEPSGEETEITSEL